ncbi:metallophosphoesterase family protein [Aureimonas phyllosphaerae]|uniref:Serine/threonine protein phosphatase 1 n=1 Tax=Aureimonas phyllosphaerae TaxID=1166078 RepID=A0A7W6BWL5_9HYPH|nr:metallophosphoesterase family protein [Aureimonas phyllosphaerae]MBB3937389.1 serine/threonine protein phosphatase 1 [Aureimonas phyllosphaerae]MBB3961396.1 serine/threonine protein phosphatase 1 [Aureimonas phyllosphaerae]SFF42555.1 serine/threonine protein phosphatase 1 [Aureimonas phyllosphaerae]
MHTVTYAIGDIHGRLDLLEDLLGKVEGDAEARGVRARIVFTGDYVDRGADSRGVIERLMAGPKRSQDEFVCLRGNHDDLFVRAITLGEGLPDWAWLLYWHTVVSYGLDRQSARDSDPTLNRHAEFLAGLPLTHDDGTHLFVHAGIRPGVALDLQAEQDLLWIRHEFLDYDGPLPRRVVHGHTIIGDLPIVTANRISIDTGAFQSGILTAAVIDGPEISFLQAVGEPDRSAVVREFELRAIVHGRVASPIALQAQCDYLEGRIGLADLQQLSDV